MSFLMYCALRLLLKPANESGCCSPRDSHPIVKFIFVILFSLRLGTALVVHGLGKSHVVIWPGVLLLESLDSVNHHLITLSFVGFAE